MLDSPPGFDGSLGLSQTAYKRLRAAIIDRTFKPGDRMREVELAEWLGISRTPTRDALRRLESEGLLRGVTGQRGLVVTELDQQQVSEIYALRSVLDGLAARLAAQYASDAEIAALRENLERQERTSEQDSEELVRLNRQFHLTVFRAARNRYLADALESLESSLALLPGTTYSASKRPSEALEQHRAVLEAIAARQAPVAELAATLHMHAAERIRLTMMADAG